MVARRRRGGRRAGLPDGQPRRRPTPDRCPATGIYAGWYATPTALAHPRRSRSAAVRTFYERRRAAGRGVPARTSTATSTASGSTWRSCAPARRGALRRRRGADAPRSAATSTKPLAWKSSKTSLSRLPGASALLGSGTRSATLIVRVVNVVRGCATGPLRLIMAKTLWLRSSRSSRSYQAHDDGHGLARGADRDADRPDLAPHRAPQGPQGRSSHPPWTHEAHRPASPPARLRAARTTSSATARSSVVSAFVASRGIARPDDRSTCYNRHPRPRRPVDGSSPQRERLPTGIRAGCCQPHKEHSMTDAIRVSGPITGTDKTLSFEAGKLAQLADGAVVARIGDTIAAGHRHRRPHRARGRRLLPPDRRHRGAGLRRGQDPRRVLPPRGQGLGPGHPDLPAHRPPAAPFVPEGLPQRGPRRRHDLRRRPGEPARRPRHQRRLGRADDLGHPLRRPHRRRAHGLHHRRRVDPAPHLRRGRRSHVRARRRRPRARATPRTPTSPS